MRVTSSFWVGALVRRCNAAGAAAFVTRRGAEEAGAIFVVVDRLDGAGDLYAPAPQLMFDEARPADRRFERVAAASPLDELGERLERERGFDPDLWIVTIEDREGRAFVDVAGPGDA